MAFQEGFRAEKSALGNKDTAAANRKRSRQPRGLAAMGSSEIV